MALTIAQSDNAVAGCGLGSSICGLIATILEYYFQDRTFDAQEGLRKLQNANASTVNVEKMRAEEKLGELKEKKECLSEEEEAISLARNELVNTAVSSFKEENNAGLAEYFAGSPEVPSSEAIV